MTNAKRIIEGLIVLVIGLALLPIVRSFVTDAQNGSTSGESALLGLITFVWILIILAVAIGLIYSGSKK